MKEYGIIRLESIDLINSNYYKLIDIFDKENLVIEGILTYSTPNASSEFNLVDTVLRYLVFLISGSNVNLKLKLIRDELNNERLDKEQQIYVSTDETLDSDLKKYFNLTLSDIDVKLETLPFREKTIAIIKPDGMDHQVEIKQMITNSGLNIIRERECVLTKDTLEKYYSHFLDTQLYHASENYIMPGPVVIMELEGYDAIQKLRKLIGPSDSKKAQPNTIRGKFGKGTEFNVIHGSDSKKSVRVETNIFFNEKEKVLK